MEQRQIDEIRAVGPLDQDFYEAAIGQIGSLYSAPESRIAFFDEVWERMLPLELLPRGSVVGTAELVGCYEIVRDRLCRSRILFPPGGADDDEPFGHDEISEEDDEFLFGDWTPGRFAWEFANMKMLDVPIPVRGGQRIWNWEEKQNG